MACDRLVFRRYINFLLCLYIDLWTLKNFVIINSNTSFVLILFFFIDFFFSVHSKNVILLSNLLLSDISNMSSFLLLLYQWIHRCFLFLFDISRKKKKKKKSYTSFRVLHEFRYDLSRHLTFRVTLSGT